MIWKLKPIGFYKTSKIKKLEAARQSNQAIAEKPGFIELSSKSNFEQALSDLEGFSHIWLIFIFHLNTASESLETNNLKALWKPMVQPPRFSKTKRGVFSTRSPYRPNPIGLSLVEIDQIKGRQVYLKNCDLLNGTPILDIKPFIESSDRPLKTKQGWMSKAKLSEVIWSKIALSQKKWLLAQKQNLIIETIEQQLSGDPTNSSSKRVRKIGPSTFEYSYRLWRIQFTVNRLETQTNILAIKASEPKDVVLPTQEMILIKKYTEAFD